MLKRYIFQIIFCILISGLMANMTEAATLSSVKTFINNKKSRLELQFHSSQRFKLDVRQRKNTIFLAFPGSHFKGNMSNMLALQKHIIPFLPELNQIVVSHTIPSGHKGLFIALHFKGHVKVKTKPLSPYQMGVHIYSNKSWSHRQPTYQQPTLQQPALQQPIFKPDVKPTPYPTPRPYYIPEGLKLPQTSRPQLKPPEQKVHWKVSQIDSVQEFISRSRSPKKADVLTKLHWKEAFDVNKHQWYPLYKNQDISTHKYLQIGPGESVQLQSSDVKLWLKDIASVDLNGSIVDLHRGWMLVKGRLPVKNNYQFKVHPEFTPITLTSHGDFAFMVSSDHLIVLKGYIEVNDSYHLHDQSSHKIERGQHLDLKSHKLHQLTARQLDHLLTEASMQHFVKTYR